MGKYPKLVRLRQLIEQYGNEAALFQYLEDCGQFGDGQLKFLRNINDIVTNEFDGVRRDSGQPHVSHLHAVCAIGLVYCGNHDTELLAAALFHDIMKFFPDRWPMARVQQHSTQRTTYIVNGCSFILHDIGPGWAIKQARKAHYKRMGDSIDFAVLTGWSRVHN